MSFEQPKGPFCQSCGMPMQKPDDFGTLANGFKNNDYCKYCFQDGQFTDPDITMEKYIDKVIGIMVRQNIMPEAQATKLMREVIPTLKRWK